MAKGLRRRIEPAAAGDTHNIYGATGLGAGDNGDAEAVLVISDRLTFGSALISNGGTGELRTSWTPCEDCSILRVSAIYRASTGERDLLVAYQDAAGLVVCAGSDVFTPSNTGIETATSSGLYYGGTYFAFDCRGMSNFMVIVKPGTTALDIYAAAA